MEVVGVVRLSGNLSITRESGDRTEGKKWNHLMQCRIGTARLPECLNN